MKDPRPHGLPRGERAGPLFLLALLLAAFIPSVFISFDLRGLLQTMAEAALAASEARAPVHHTLMPGDLADAEGRGILEVPAILLVSSGSGAHSPASSKLEIYGPCPEARPVAGGHEWPPGPAASPRSPPLPSLAGRESAVPAPAASLAA